MLISRTSITPQRIEGCHEGHGALWCAELLADYDKQVPGFAYVHDNHLEPGASIGEHRHEDDEELYVILSGTGLMRIDGQSTEVGPGDACLTRAGHSHDLTNGPSGPMHFLVICTKTMAATP